jgi:hypothetical protein
MLIYDGFESHLDAEVVNYCWNHHIIPYCLPSHTSQILQPLDVGVFSPLQHYYSEEVNKIGAQAITNDDFPNLFARARQKALTPKNIKAGFRAAGISPFCPGIVLSKIKQREHTPGPRTLGANPQSNHSEIPVFSTPQRLQQAHDEASWICQTPVTPRGIIKLGKEAEQTIISASPHSSKQRALMIKQSHVARRLYAELQMSKAGERHLRENQKSEKVKSDKRKLNSGSALIVTRESVLRAEKLERDQKSQAEPPQKRMRSQTPWANPILPATPILSQDVESPLYTPYVLRF